MDERRTEERRQGERRELELHVCTTGQLFSFRPSGSPLEARSALFSALRYGEGPGAVLVFYGIQGEHYFLGLPQHFERVFDGVRCAMGFVWKRHTPIYQRVLRGRCEVEVLFSARPYGEDGPLMDWIIGWKGKRPER